VPRIFIFAPPRPIGEVRISLPDQRGGVSGAGSARAGDEVGHLGQVEGEAIAFTDGPHDGWIGASTRRRDLDEEVLEAGGLMISSSRAGPDPPFHIEWSSPRGLTM